MSLVFIRWATSMKDMNKGRTGVLGRYVAASEAARILELSAHRVRQLTDLGLLPHLQTPLGRLYLREHIERIRQLRGPFGTYRTADLRQFTIDVEPTEHNRSGDEI